MIRQNTGEGECVAFSAESGEIEGATATDGKWICLNQHQGCDRTTQGQVVWENATLLIKRWYGTITVSDR